MSTTIHRKNAFRAVRENNINGLAKAVKNRIEANWRAGGHPTGNTLLESACELGHIEVAAWLVDHGSDINAYCIDVPLNVKVINGGKVSDGASYLGPLSTAIYFKQARSLAFLMSRGVNLDLPWERHGSTIIRCRDFLANHPDFVAEAEAALLDMEASAGQAACRRRAL